MPYLIPINIREYITITMQNKRWYFVMLLTALIGFKAELIKLVYFCNFSLNMHSTL